MISFIIDYCQLFSSLIYSFSVCKMSEIGKDEDTIKFTVTEDYDSSKYSHLKIIFLLKNRHKLMNQLSKLLAINFLSMDYKWLKPVRLDVVKSNKLLSRYRTERHLLSHCYLCHVEEMNSADTVRWGSVSQHYLIMSILFPNVTTYKKMLW